MNRNQGAFPRFDLWTRADSDRAILRSP